MLNTLTISACARARAIASVLQWSRVAGLGAACLLATTHYAGAQGAPPASGAAPPGIPGPPPGAFPPGAPFPAGSPPTGAAPPGGAGLPAGGPPPDSALAAFREQLAADQLPLSGKWPSPSPDPRNFEGVWRQYNMLPLERSTDMYGALTPLNPAGRALLAKRMAAARAGTPYVNASAVCLPPGQPLQLEINLPFVIYQNKDWIQFLFYQYHGAWAVVLDPAQQPDKDTRPYMGRSVGHWEGSTLVVETSGFRQPLWLDINGTPVSADARLTHRIRKVHQGAQQGDWSLEVITTLDDPTYYLRPWSWATAYVWRPDKAPIGEYDCEYSVNRPDYLPSSGMVPEPNN